MLQWKNVYICPKNIVAHWLIYNIVKSYRNHTNLNAVAIHFQYDEWINYLDEVLLHNFNGIFDENPSMRLISSIEVTTS